MRFVLPGCHSEAIHDLRTAIREAAATGNRDVAGGARAGYHRRPALSQRVISHVSPAPDASQVPVTKIIRLGEARFPILLKI
jgi:hypothetical protein